MGRNVCVTVVVLLCSIAIVLADTKQYSNVSYFPASWMKDLGDIIYDKTLLEITLPGSHDSGAYEFSDELSPIDPKLVDDLIYLGTLVGLDIYGFIKNWSITQNTTIFEQLQGGIRYLDLRACELKGDWYTQHFLVGTKTQDLLNDIQKFMQMSTGEVIVVELGQLVPVTDELTLIHMFQNTLGEYLAPQLNLNVTTIGEMVKNNHRIVLLYPGDSPYLKNFTFLWDKDNFVEGSYANMDKLDNMVNWNINELNLYGGVGKFFELSWTLTTQDSDIIKTLLDPFLRVKTLKEMALEADGYLATFAYQYNNFMLGNILLVDFWEASGVVDLVISRNLRNCHDDPNLIATDPSGLYCRSFFEKGVCTNPRYSQWMQSHCELSCGVC